MPKYIFVGDILHPGKVAVEADTLEDALMKLSVYDFEVVDESDKHLAFNWNEDEDTVEVEED